LIYFDNAATTYPKPEDVYQALDFYNRKMAVNVGRGQYPLADNAASIVEKTRIQIKALFSAPSKQVIFEPSATIALNVVLRGLDWNSIHTVYVSPFEHNAVCRTLNYLKTQFDFSIKILEVKKAPFLFDLDLQKKVFAQFPPDLVVLSHASNMCGSVAPVKELFSMAKRYGSLTVLDTAQSAGLIDLNSIDCQVDFTVFAGHKALMGPLGIGGIVMDEKLKLNPFLYGGTGFDSRNLLMPAELPSKFEAGSSNIVAIAGLSTSLEWIACKGISYLHEQEQLKYTKLKEMLLGFDCVSLIGTEYQGNQVGVLSCLMEGYSVDEVGLILGQHDIAVRTGLHCAPSAHEFFGTFPEGTIRLSVGYFTTENDIEELDNLLKQL
jgi:cysteine desulfurase family protein